jgi:hypothetical protein
MVEALGRARRFSLVHPAGDTPFNPLLVMWLLPMIAERTGDPIAFVESTIKGEVRYDSPEWVEAFGLIADLRESRVLLDGSGATDYATMQLLFLQGKAAMTYNGTWLLEAQQAGTPTVPFDLHVAPLPSSRSSKAHSILAWAGFALPAKVAASRDSVYAFLEFASRPEVDASVVEGLRPSPIPRFKFRDPHAVQREFLPMLRTRSRPSTGSGSPRSTPRSGTRSSPREWHDGPRPVGAAIKPSRKVFERRVTGSPLTGQGERPTAADARGTPLRKVAPHASPLLATKFYVRGPDRASCQPSLTDRLLGGTEARVDPHPAPAEFRQIEHLLAEWLASGRMIRSPHGFRSMPATIIRANSGRT